MNSDKLIRLRNPNLLEKDGGIGHELDRNAPHSIAIQEFCSARRRTLCSLSGATLPIWLLRPPVSNAIELNTFFKDDRRQLELCIVNILRTQYWAMRVSASIDSSIRDKNYEEAKNFYLEARLGSKAILTGKLGSGSNYNVYQLANFQLRGCLKDTMLYCKDNEKQNAKQQRSKKKEAAPSFSRVCSSREAEDVAQEIIESFASCLEFDGLDNLEDPSPRSSLMRTQYTEDKAKFVVRMLTERSIPKCAQYLDLMYALSNEPNELKRTCSDYVQRNYASEIPSELISSAAETDVTESS